MNGDRQGRRGLSSEDRALWNKVRKSIKPLRVQPDEASMEVAPPAEPQTKKKPPVSRSAPVARPEKKLPPLAPLGRRERQRLTRGRSAVDDRLDLHGLTLERAFPRLRAFLENAQAKDAGLVLVITGKGSAAAERPGEERGVLRRQVPMWLALPELRPLVIGFEEASRAHGGAGAFYVRIRRRRAQRM